jgi:hypothetical protein
MKTMNKKRIFVIISAFIVSNLLFYLLIKNTGEEHSPVASIEGVEIQLTADILTPLVPGKKVTVLSHDKSISFHAHLQLNVKNEDKVLLIIKEQDLRKIQNNMSWAIYPFSNQLISKQKTKGYSYEIYY